MNLLSEIVAKKSERLAHAKKLVSFDGLRSNALATRNTSTPHLLRRALQADGINIIAEFKRRSPSKGVIRADADLSSIVGSYAAGGAVAISVLTEEDHFDGSLADLQTVKTCVDLPVLRKDFIVDEYQVYESAAAGADAVLLIVAALEDQPLGLLRRLAEDELGMDALVEVHSAEEMDRAAGCGAKLIGINNRDLRTFAVTLETSLNVVRGAPEGALLVSESGLNSAADLRRLKDHGFNGFLIGESLMRAERPDEKLRELTGRTLVKICGITNFADALAAVEAGADALGFNFYRSSPRYISPRDAQEIIDQLPCSIIKVGVFVNEDVKSVLRIASEANLNAVQLHGDESPDYCRQFGGKYVIKAFGATMKIDRSAVDAYEVDAIMLDTKDDLLRGGTGRIFDWSIAQQVNKSVKSVALFLAGGLSPENVGEAISQVRPYAVDACSSLEDSPGRKNHERMRAFVQTVRSVRL